MYIYIRTIVLLLLIGSLVALKEQVLTFSGGGIAFFFVSCMLITLSAFRKKFARALTSLSAIFACLYFINMLFAIQLSADFSYLTFTNIVVCLCIAVFVLLICYAMLNSPPVPVSDEKKRVLAGIKERLIFAPGMGLCYIITANIIIEASKFERYFIPIGISVAILSYLINYACLKGIDWRIIAYVYDYEEKIDITWVRHSAIVLVVFLALGMGVEFIRGHILFLLLNYILLAVIFLSSWQVWKYLFIEHETIATIDNIKPLTNMASNPKRLFVLIGIACLIGVIWLLSLGYIVLTQ